jgi:hypothetical protein
MSEEKKKEYPELVPGVDFVVPPDPPDDDDPYWDKDAFVQNKFIYRITYEPQHGNDLNYAVHFQFHRVKGYEEKYPVTAILAFSELGSELSNPCIWHEEFLENIPDMINHTKTRFELGVSRKIGLLSKMHWALVEETMDCEESGGPQYRKLLLRFDENDKCVGCEIVPFPESDRSAKTTENLLRDRCEHKIRYRDSEEPGEPDPTIRDTPDTPVRVHKWSLPWDPRDPNNKDKDIYDILVNRTRRSKAVFVPDCDDVFIGVDGWEEKKLKVMTEFAEKLSELCSTYNCALKAQNCVHTHPFYKIKYKVDALMQNNLEFDVIQFHDEHDVDSPEFAEPTEWWDFVDIDGVTHFLGKRYTDGRQEQ